MDRLRFAIEIVLGLRKSPIRIRPVLDRLADRPCRLSPRGKQPVHPI